mmetsp:Transcript_7077/g.9986  ORF Transcript_7077/g.9986 Transcript_7077/m.9986 type:complete len:623 (+) Transcript_7077:89-1957(+)
MAGKKEKEFRQRMADVAEWVQKLEFPGLTVAEIYSDVFGPCDVMKPTINKFMMNEEDAEKIIQFVQVNLTTMDEDVKARMAEEKKKEAERAMLAARQAAMNGGAAPAEKKKENTKESQPPTDGGDQKGGDDEKKEEGKEEKTDDGEEENDEEQEWDEKFKIPIVDQYMKISPRPLFLFIKDGQVIDELTTASPPLMILMIKNAMSGRKTSEVSGLQQRIAEKRAAREAEQKKKEEEEALAKLRNVPVETLEKQNSETSEAIIAAFKDHQGFAKLSAITTAEIKKRDDDDNAKLAVGIKLAIDKGVLPSDKADPSPVAINVLGKSPDEVTAEIIEKLGDAPSKGCIMTLEGLSGTGKGTTVAKLKEKLPKSTTWSNGDIFRSITLLATKFAEEKKVELDEALKPENLAEFTKMLKFDKFEDDTFDVEIDGLGVKERVSKVNKTLLKSKEVATNIPKVAAVTQGEVIMFVKEALAKMAEAGLTVLVEGRAATLKYIDTPHRFELIMSDENIIGARRAAQRIGASAVASAEDMKEGKTWEILENVCKSMLPKEEISEVKADEAAKEEKPEEKKEGAEEKGEEAKKEDGPAEEAKKEEGEEAKKEEAKEEKKEEAKKEEKKEEAKA